MRYLYLLLFLIGCQKQPASFSGSAMTMPYQVKIGDCITAKQKRDINQCILATFAKVNKTINHWNPKSELAKYNGSTPPSPLLKELFIRADQIVELSDGYYDPAIAPMIALWKSSLSLGQIPSIEELTSATPLLEWDEIYGYFENNCPLNQNIKLDFDAIVKGLTVDLLAKELTLLGYENFFIEWSGESKAVGKHFSGREWRVEIKHGQGKILSLENKSIATSGDYEQLWKIGDEHYTHFIDKETLRPLQPSPLMGVTVVADTCALADGLATVAMLIQDPEKQNAWMKKIQELHPDVAFYPVFRSFKPGFA